MCLRFYEDAHRSAEQISEFEKAVSTLAIPHEVELYTGAHHYFTVADLPAYQAAAAEKHWTQFTHLLQSTL